MFKALGALAGTIKGAVERQRNQRKLRKLEELGMKIGQEVFVPLSTWIDVSHCHLIAIGNRCRFGPNCVILAHDATMNEFLDAGRVGRVLIHDSCSFGFGTVILPGVEIGPRVVSGVYSVIASDIPEGSIVTGNPARVVGKSSDFVRYHTMAMKRLPCFPYQQDANSMSEGDQRRIVAEALERSRAGYMTGGYSGRADDPDFYSGRRF